MHTIVGDHESGKRQYCSKSDSLSVEGLRVTFDTSDFLGDEVVICGGLTLWSLMLPLLPHTKIYPMVYSVSVDEQCPEKKGQRIVRSGLEGALVVGRCCLHSTLHRAYHRQHQPRADPWPFQISWHRSQCLSTENVVL